MEGIKESKEMIEFIADLAMAFVDAKKDGEISLSDALAFLPLIPEGAAALGGASLILVEAGDYSKEEIQALSALFKAKLDLPDDKVEEYVEYGLNVGLYLAKLVAGLKK